MSKQEWKEAVKDGNAPDFIDRAIGMLKEQYKDEWLVAGYNGIVALLGYAKVKIANRDAELTRLQEENERLKGELIETHSLKDAYGKKILRLKEENKDAWHKLGKAQLSIDELKWNLKNMEKFRDEWKQSSDEWYSKSEVFESRIEELIKTNDQLETIIANMEAHTYLNRGDFLK